MALNSNGFTTMSGYVQRMKEEADRREEEERRKKEEEARRQSLASWRRDVPIGPPTQEQARAPQLGPIEKPKSNITLPQQKQTSFEVSRPETDTSTPSLSSSQVTQPTVQSRANPSAFNPGSMTMDALAKWNPPKEPPKYTLPQMPPKNTGVAMPLGPSLLPQVGKQLLGAGQNIIQGLSEGKWQMPDYATALKTMQEQAPDMLKAIFPQGRPPAAAVPSPADMGYQHTVDSMAQREKERQNVSVAGTLAINLVGNFIPGLKPLAGVAGKGMSALYVGGMNLLDILNAGAEIAQAVPITKGGLTEGELYAKVRDVGDRYNANMRVPYVKAATAAIDSMLQSNPLYAPFTENLKRNAEYLAVLDPQVWQSISNTAEYWDAAGKRLTDAVIPTPEQVAGNTKEQIEWAKNYATYMTQFGIGVREAVFDDILDAPIAAAKKMADAQTLAKMADSTPDETLRNQIYAEAGRLSAQAVKLRETTPLDLYNKHQNMWYGAPNQMLFDPINTWDTVSDIAMLGMAARRAKQGQKVIDLGSDAVQAGSNKTVLETGKEFFTEWMKTLRSKANTDAYTNSSAIFNVLSGVSTKGDIAVVLRKIADGSIMGGIPLAEFNGADMAMQAAGDLVDFGKAGIKDWRFQKSKKAMESIAGWVDNFSSLSGDPTEQANKILVQADILGALTRASAQRYGVSAMGEIPWGAQRFRVSPIAANKAVVEFLDAGKKVIGQSEEMTLRAASKLQAQMQQAVATGAEFKTNWLREVVNLRRNIMSTYSINISPGQIINNAGGGAFVHAMNNGFDMEYFRPLEDELEYLANKTGGMIMSARVAEGAADVAPASARFGVQGTTPQGQYSGWFGKLMNFTTAGLAEKGRNLRQGDFTLWGGRVKVGEEAMAASVYQATFRRFFEQEWPARLRPLMENLAQGKLTDPAVLEHMIDHVVQAGLSGSRIDVAKAFQDVANGRISISLRSISPVLADVLPPSEVVKIDGMLRNLGAEGVEPLNEYLTGVFAGQRRLLDMDASKYMEQFGRTSFTRMNDIKDKADIAQLYQNIAQMTGQNMDIGSQKAKELGALQEKLGQYLLDLMQMSDGQPHNTEYLLDVWNRIQDMKDTARRNVGQASEKLRQFANDAKIANADTLESVGAPGPLRAPDAPDIPGKSYTVGPDGIVNPKRPEGMEYGQGAVDDILSREAQGLDSLAAEAAPESDFAGSRFTSGGPGRWIKAPWNAFDSQGVPPPVDNAVNDLLNFNIKEEWAKFHKNADEQWKKFGDDAIAAMEQARQDIQSGAAKTWVNQRGLAGLGDDANEILSNTSVDLEMLTEVLKQKMGFKDPRRDGIITTLRKGMDHFQQQMFIALSRYPTQESFDEYMDAIRDVARERGKLIGKIDAIKKKINNTENPLDPDALKAAFAQLEQTQKEGWNKWWNFAMDRYKVGAYRVVEANLPSDTMKSLTFVPYADGKVWTLRGPDLLSPRVWVAVNEAGEEAKFPMGKGGVPKDVVQKFMEFRKASELEIMDQLGNIAYQSARSKGLDVADAWLTQWNTPGTTDLLNTIRRNVAEKMANLNARPYIPADLPGWYRTKLDQSEMALKQILGQVAQANSAGYGKMGLDAISEFNRNILPLFDDVVSGAHRYGEEMLSLGMVNFTNEYHPDILLGLFAPYHYWWGRMAKNSLEHMIFHPKVSQLLARQLGYIEAENRDQNQPNRNITSIPYAEVDANNASYRAGALGLLRMIPWFPNMVMNGWANPDIANRAYEYATEAAKEQAFPGTAKGLAANAMLAHEFANEFGLSTYPEYDAIFDYAAGNPVELRGKLGDMSSLARTMGWGAVAFAEWARDNNIPIVPGLAEGFAAGTVPNYAPSIYSREAALAASRGDLNDNQARMVQDVFAQGYNGMGPMPEQGLINPQAVQQAGDIRQKTAMEYFVRGLISWISGVPIAAEYDNEIALNEAQKEKAASSYDPTRNPAGSQAARFSYTDPESKNYVPGLAPWEQRYSVMNETAPQQTDPSVKRPGLSAAQNEYYDKADAIKQKYLAEQQAEYDKHPEWKTTDGLDGKNAYDKDWKDRKEAEEKALADKYPSVIAAQGKEKTPWSLYGARPSETEREAQVRLRNQAYKELESSRPKEYSREEKAALSNSEKVANSKAWDAWNAKLDARIAELMNDPQAASASVFDRALPRVGERAPGSVSDVLRGNQPATPTTKNVVQPQGVIADPNNKWAAEMAAAEVEYGLPSGLLQEVARNESNFDPNAKSGAGAVGLMQIMPDTWAEWSKKVGVTDPTDPASSIKVSAAYLAWLKETLPADQQDLTTIMQAYNYGIGHILDGDPIPPETTSYANAIVNAVEGQGNTVAQLGGQTFIRPVEGGPSMVSQGYGANVDNYKKWNGEYGHEGIDYGVPVGTPVMAAAGGTVEFAGTGNGFGNYGNYVVIDHGNGYHSYYAHLDSFDVQVGDTIEQGQVIANSGNSGRSSGPHLHFGIRKDGDTSGPYEMINPTDYILGKKNLPGTTQNVVQTPTQPTSSNPDAIAWSQTPQQVADAGRNSNKSAGRIEADAAIEAEFQGQIDRAMKTYPKYGKLFDEYKAVNDEDREAWRLKNPMIRALNFVAYNPDEWTKLEKEYGAGIIEKWALIPPYAGQDSDVRSDYYHQYPDVFLVNAWIKGRPEEYDDSGFVPDAQFAYNLGADFDEAKRRFGDGIWDTVRQYYQTPKYVKGGDNTAWLAFKKEHPEFDQWADWWYEKLGNQKEPFQFNQWGNNGFNGFSGRSAGFQEPQYIKNVEAMRAGAPKWSEGGSGGDDWRKYLALGELNLKGWRR